MVIAIFLTSVVLAFGVSFGVARLAKDVMEALLRRFISQELSEAVTRYMGFAVMVVGVASGSRVRLLEDFVGAPVYNRDALNAQLTPEVWVAAMYHTVLESLEGVAWLFILVALILLAALFVIRKTKPEWLADPGGQEKSSEAT
jgi:ABC-type xylose transport system permease subunit